MALVKNGGQLMRVGSSLARIWTPANLTGLFAWATARLETGYSDDDFVEPITDHSGNLTNGFQQSTESQRFKYKTNGKNGLPVFRGTYAARTYAESDSFEGVDAPYTVYLAMKGTIVPGVSWYPVISDGVSDPQIAFSSLGQYGQWNGSSFILTPSTYSNVPVIATFIIKNGPGSIIRINGTQVVSGNTGTGGSLSGWLLGESGNGFNGDLYEAIIVLGESPSNQINDAENGLNRIWNIY